MKNIRKATKDDLSRITEIIIFNYRLNFYPIFKDEIFYFKELQVLHLIDLYKPLLKNIFVYDDGAVKGFIHIDSQEVKKLFVEPILQGQSIGSALLQYAIEKFNVNTLWVLEKNTRALSFYKRHGFQATNDQRLEEDTTEYLIRLER